MLIYKELPVKFTSNYKSYWGGLHNDSEFLALIEFVTNSKQVVLFIARDLAHSQNILKNLDFYNNNIPIINFADYEVLAYDNFSPHQSIISQRLQALIDIAKIKHGIIISTIESLLQRLCPEDFVINNNLCININDSLNLTQFSKILVENGYYKTTNVRESGEFSVKGSLLDLYPAGVKQPFRINLFDDKVEDIRIFDSDTQLSITTIKRINILPAKEFATNSKSIDKFKDNYHKYFNSTNSYVYEEVSNNRFIAGIEFYLPLFFDNTSSLLDYLPSETIIASNNSISVDIKLVLADIKDRYLSVSTHNDFLLPAEAVFLTDKEIFNKLAQHNSIIINSAKFRGNKKYTNYDIKYLPPLKIPNNHTKPLTRLLNFINTFNGNILLVSESSGRQSLIIDLLVPYNISPIIVNNYGDFITKKPKLAITTGLIDKGFLLTDTAIISETDIFGKTSVQQRRRRAKHKDFSDVIKNLIEINTGDAIVHEQYGVGRYLGLKTIKYDDIEQDFIHIVYANDDKLMLPVSDLNLVGRYAGINLEHTPLHSLGSYKWANAKKKISDELHDIATELLEIYAKRASESGFACSPPSDSYTSFVNEFNFEETPDQITTMEAVLNDMLSDNPMDRLVCGDVGFGKTEIAMRASFIAVESNKQVAILAPTTLLTEQHYQSFIDRFANYPIKIGALSRFQSTKEQKQIITNLKLGLLDIVIGTHKLIQNRVIYKDLGLIVIDEEHRFGVKQKEKLNNLRANADILTMSATPIPRTLNMALGSLRDLSIIATPPIGRMSIETFVGTWQDEMIVEACMREIHRAGQIFLLHNDIDTIDIIADNMNKLIANIKIKIAHGKMASKELEAIMSDFYHKRFHILVCTTIIESGIDIPNANTIIINNAQNFGLAQLHQLRGRVGRSHHKAYAYLITKAEQGLTEDAKKRLKAISSLEAVGSGFLIANNDLEIRGSGELLGKNQSGRIQSIGFNLYHDILARTIKAIKSGKEISNTTDKIVINSNISCIIPARYMPDTHTRLMFYKRISQVKNDAELLIIKTELIDRFGELEDATKSLFASNKLKLLARKIGINNINIYSDRANITFAKNTNINIEQIISLMQENPAKYQLKNQNTLIIKAVMPDNIKRIEIIYKFLNRC